MKTVMTRGAAGIFIALIAAVAVMALTPAVEAAPNPGVGSGEYICDTTPSSDYTECFSGEYVSGDEDGHGWQVASGDTITVFTSSTVGCIWLVTTYNDTNNIRFNGDSATPIVLNGGDHFDSYETPYMGWNLGEVDTSDGWAELSGFPGSATYYGFEGVLTWDGQLDPGTYFFAVIDEDCDGLDGQGSGSGGDHDPFSPKTDSSTTRVPEPASALLMGGGILVLLGAARARRKRS